jgi:hypothetical protein
VGVLVVFVLKFVFSAWGGVILATVMLGFWNPIGRQLLEASSGMMGNIWGLVIMSVVWILAAKSQNRVSLWIESLERRLHTNSGAAWLIAIVMLCNLTMVMARMILVELLNQMPNNGGFAFTPLTAALFVQLMVELSVWSLPPAVALIILVRSDKPVASPQLVTG